MPVQIPAFNADQIDNIATLAAARLQAAGKDKASWKDIVEAVLFAADLIPVD